MGFCFSIRTYSKSPHKVNSIRTSVCPWTQFCLELFSYSFACTALKFIHNVCVHVKLCMCNFHNHTIIGCGIISPWTCKFYLIIVVQRNNPAVFHVLNSKLHNVTGSIQFCMCNFHYHTVIDCWIISPWTCKFSKIIVIRSITPTFLQVLLWNLHIMFVCIWSCEYAIFMSVCLSIRPSIDTILSRAFLLQFCT